MTKELHGIDISHHQSPDSLNWGTISQSSQFVFARATYGATQDRLVQRHFADIRSYGLIGGLYHFFRPSIEINKQISAFLTVARDLVGLKEGDLLPALDIEFDPIPAPGIGVEPGWNDNLQIFVEKMKEEFGGTILYMTRADWVALGKPGWCKEHPLWVAHWRKSGSQRRPPIDPAVPDDMKWAIHQYGVGKYDPFSGIQDHTSPNAIDHNRAFELPLIVANKIEKAASLGAVDLDKINALTNDAAKIDWDRYRENRDKKISTDTE